MSPVELKILNNSGFGAPPFNRSTRNKEHPIPSEGSLFNRLTRARIDHNHLKEPRPMALDVPCSLLICCISVPALGTFCILFKGIKIKVSFFGPHLSSRKINLAIGGCPGGETIYITIEHAKCCSD